METRKRGKSVKKGGIMAHGVAKSPSSQSATTGGPNAVDLLQEEHDRVRRLFARFRQARQKEQSVIAAQIFNNLELHARLEEQIFYPAFASIGQEAADTVAVSIQEHQVVKDLVQDLRGLSLNDRGFGERFEALRENVLDHATEEEETVFPAARLNLDLYGLGRNMAQMKLGGGIQTVRSFGALIRRYPAQALLIGASILVVLSKARTMSRSR
jgi:hemerythrin superfamily protein